MSCIDIHSGKLTEWVISRFKMNKDWSEKVNIIREKISNAILDMPETEEIKILLLGTYINYFHCLKILDILKETELKSKNIFGQYSSKRIKDWQEVIKLYEQNSYYIIDCAQILNQFVCFDIPAVKKSIEKNNKTIKDAERKEKDHLSTVNEANNNLKNILQKYSIQIDINDSFINDVIRVQLKKSVKDLKPLLDEIEEQFSILREPSSLYIRIVKATFECEKTDECLPMITYLLSHGNSTVYEWKYGNKPTNVIAEGICNEKESSIVTEEEEIVWDYVCADEVDAEIDFGIELEGETIDKEAAGETTANELLTLLENHETREMLLDDLHELIAFFTSCLDETKLRAGSILDSIENIEEKWPELNCETVSSMQNQIINFMDQLSSKHLIHILQLQTNTSYVDSIICRIEHERSVLLKYRNLISILKNRVTESARENIILEQQLQTMKQQCGTLKNQVEMAISKSFGDRNVRIVGEIGTI